MFERKINSFFCVNVRRYDPDRDFNLVCPASLTYPKNNSVMFVTSPFLSKISVLESVRNCLVYIPCGTILSESLKEKHVFVLCENPHTEFCKFFKENRIQYLPSKESGKIIGGAWIADSAQIGENVTIMPGAYIGGQCFIGNDVYIGCGTKLVGEIYIGENVIIRENTVIGADGLTTDRLEDGTAVTMPQFGCVILEDNVQIGANTTIARGAIDFTIIRRGAKIDNNCFVSHNVDIGEDSFVVGETILFGSSSVGRQSMISGNSTIRNGIHIGDHALVGMGSVVVKPVSGNTVVKGNPAK